MAASTSATTGAIALIGALGGTTIGGGLTISLEMLRRRWQRKDNQDNTAEARLSERVKERKRIYSEFLSACHDFESRSISPEQVRRLVGAASPEVFGPVEMKRRLEVFVNEFERMLPHMSDLAYKLSQVLLIADPKVSRLAEKYHEELNKLFRKGIFEDNIDTDLDKIRDDLIRAMKEELDKI